MCVCVVCVVVVVVVVVCVFLFFVVFVFVFVVCFVCVCVLLLFFWGGCCFSCSPTSDFSFCFPVQPFGVLLSVGSIHFLRRKFVLKHNICFHFLVAV